MEAQAHAADVIRKAWEAYAEGLSAVMKALQGLPPQGGETYRRMVEQWLLLARTSKDSFVAAVNQSFDLWERECRRFIGAPHPPGAAAPSANPMEAWMESWKRTMEAFASAPSSAYNEAVKKQAELAQQALQEGMRAWQRLWQPMERK